MWTPEDRALVGDYGSGQALSDDQYRLLEPLIPPAKPGGRLRATEVARSLAALVQGLRAPARGVRGHGQPRHDPPHGPSRRHPNRKRLTAP